MKPLRMCAVCRERREKDSLIRIAKNSNGDIALDSNGAAPGRGAYICRSGPCIKAAQKRRALERAFSTAVPTELYTELLQKIPEGVTDDE